MRRQTLESDVTRSGWLLWFHGATASFPAPFHQVRCRGRERVAMVAFTLILTFSVQMTESVCVYGYARACLHAVITDNLLTAQVTAGSVMPDQPEITCNPNHSQCTNSLPLVWQTTFSYAALLPRGHRRATQIPDIPCMLHTIRGSKCTVGWSRLLFF